MYGYAYSYFKVSIHAPWEGCDLWVSVFTQRTIVSIHAPWEGCDWIARRSVLAMYRCFNSRTLGRVRQISSYLPLASNPVSIHAPWEGCDTFNFLRFTRSSVSIHAPWEGCDIAISWASLPETCFNSRTLGRVRRSGSIFSTASVAVSIHAPWEGCDYIDLVRHDKARRFQFTHPGKGATVFADPTILEYRVSIHAPWEGCDFYSVYSCYLCY